MYEKPKSQTDPYVEFLSEEPTAVPVEAELGFGGYRDIRVPWDIRGMKVAVIVADGFEQSEFDGPVRALRNAGAKVDVLAPDGEHLAHIIGVNHLDRAEGTRGDRVIDPLAFEDYDGLLVPGGLASPDTMRASQTHLHLVRSFLQAEKPVAMICHGPWLLADADLAQGRQVTSWPAIRRDLERAGARWVDQEAVVDGLLVTSRSPADVPAFSEAFIGLLAAVKRRG